MLILQSITFTRKINANNNRVRIQIKLSEKAFLKDPYSTELGRKIITHSIQLIDEIGFEAFTFKKLSLRIKSTEASIYRYFENKHKLLIYIISWYWHWLEYNIDFNIKNSLSPEERLKIAIKTFSQPIAPDAQFEHIDEKALYRIVISESAKAYLTKEVDIDNKEGYFKSYKRLCDKIAQIILELNPNYPYPHSLISTAIESAHSQSFFALHLPSLTEIKAQNQEQVFNFIYHFIIKTIAK